MYGNSRKCKEMQGNVRKHILGEVLNAHVVDLDETFVLLSYSLISELCQPLEEQWVWILINFLDSFHFNNCLNSNWHYNMTR